MSVSTLKQIFDQKLAETGNFTSSTYSQSITITFIYLLSLITSQNSFSNRQNKKKHFLFVLVCFLLIFFFFSFSSFRFIHIHTLFLLCLETANTTTTTTSTATNSPTKSKLLVANVQQNSTHEKIVVNSSNCCNNASRLKSNQQPQSFNNNKNSFDKDCKVSSAHNNNNHRIEDISVSHRREHNKMVAKQEIELQPDVQTENEEDFKYGPGFVSKLKCRYLSLTLRQTSVSKQRPSILDLRRSTSLNNLLDEDENEEDELEEELSRGDKNGSGDDKVYHENLKNNNRNGIDSHKTMTNSYPAHDAQQQQSQNIRSSRSIDKNLNLKRARSVEAILRYDHTAWERDIEKDQKSRPTYHRSSTENETEIKKSHETVTIEDKIHSARERSYNQPPKRLTSLIDDDERPPPGICKQTMRIFEASVNKKRNTQSRPIGQEIASKMAIFKCQEKPAVAAKKPNIIPRTSSPKPINNHFSQVNNIINSNSHMNNSEKYAKYAKEKTVLPKLDINIIKNNLETKSGSWSPADNKDSYRMRNDYSPDSSISSTTSPYRNSMSPQLNNEPAYKKVSSSPTDPTSPMISSLSNKLNNLHMDVTTSTPKSYNNKHSNLLKTIDDIANDNDMNGDKESSDNKIKNNVIVELKVSDVKSLNDDISSDTKFSSKVNSNNSNQTPAKVIFEKSDLNGDLKPVKDHIVITKPTTKPPPPPVAVTTMKSVSRENGSDKSSLNSDSESSTSSGSAGQTKWAVKKKSWSSTTNDDQAANSIVFNFSDRKDVPDYIEHDGLILRRKRELPKVSYAIFFGFFLNFFFLFCVNICTQLNGYSC